MYVCENTGKLNFQFKQDGRLLRSLSISHDNDVMIVSDDLSAIHTYSTDALEVVFHHDICKKIVLTYVKRDDSFSVTPKQTNWRIQCFSVRKIQKYIFLIQK